ncbi:hypothetical protein GUITHDRAFT_121803 [Guillardia theta CCMP2712]|uniref:Uncharacterized protein n=2 Tax=Guillardia theta TaxID=55529 RepID=L1I706_GUITC|nr:hypothetical protein GUITHDRAFT_121803 [Guillardia theta CCMP2712]EKX32036.1 hypothetical protein GUITHDRAFT_121803 [Guillardia theta CCMP2712]|eukprot:XP_005819016.1 hypothetical protein GUITHDRAFT_121803 [Guillardia theta CCMP2712]
MSVDVSLERLPTISRTASESRDLLDPDGSRIIRFHCRFEAQSEVKEISMSKFTHFKRFLESVQNEFATEAFGFSYFSTEKKQEIHVVDNPGFAECKNEFVRSFQQGDGENVESMDITLKAQTRIDRLKASKKPEQFRIEREQQQIKRMDEIGAMFKAVTKESSPFSSNPHDWRQNYPLLAAAEAGDLEAINRCLDNIKDRVARANQSDILGRTALYYAAGRGRVSACELLLGMKAAADVSDHSGFTPVHKAALNGHSAIVRLLANAAANLDAKTHDMLSTPLMLAASACQIECVAALLRHGADVSAVDREERTVLEYIPEGENSANLKRLLITSSRRSHQLGADDKAREGSGLCSRAEDSKTKILHKLRKILSEVNHMDMEAVMGSAFESQIERHLEDIDRGLDLVDNSIAYIRNVSAKNRWNKM